MADLRLMYGLIREVIVWKQLILKYNTCVELLIGSVVIRNFEAHAQCQFRVFLTLNFQVKVQMDNVP